MNIELKNSPKTFLIRIRSFHLSLIAFHLNLNSNYLIHFSILIFNYLFNPIILCIKNQFLNLNLLRLLRYFDY